jgi:hypothetical protein
MGWEGKRREMEGKKGMGWDEPQKTNPVYGPASCHNRIQTKSSYLQKENNHTQAMHLYKPC